jgi:hypothetical protein
VEGNRRCATMMTRKQLEILDRLLKAAKQRGVVLDRSEIIDKINNTNYSLRIEAFKREIQNRPGAAYPAVALFVEEKIHKLRKTVAAHKWVQEVLAKFGVAEPAKTTKKKAKVAKGAVRQSALLEPTMNFANDPALNPAKARLMEVIRLQREQDERNGGHFIPEENIPCVSANGYVDSSGKRHSAEFVANIQNGRVVRLTDYKVPAGAYLSYTQEGGFCPFDLYTIFEPNSEIRTQKFKSWIYASFNQVDITAYVGKPREAIMGLAKRQVVDGGGPDPAVISDEGDR